MIELVQDNGEGPSIIRDLYSPQQSGLHHLAYFVDNLDLVSTKLDGFALETWMTYSFMKASNSSLWIGPSYSYIFKFNGHSDGAVAIGDTGNDYGILIGGTVSLPISSEYRSIKIGYYNGMTDENHNKFFVNYGFSF